MGELARQCQFAQRAGRIFAAGARQSGKRGGLGIAARRLRRVEQHRQQALRQSLPGRPVGQHRLDVVEFLLRFGQVQPDPLAQQVAAGVGEEAYELEQLDRPPAGIGRRQRRREERWRLIRPARRRAILAFFVTI